MRTHDHLYTLDYSDLISLDHPRTKGAAIIHTTGRKIREDGFYSTLDGKNVPETIDSSQTPFPPLIMLVDPRKLGTHELTKPPFPVTEEDFTSEGFEDITLWGGWNGPAIAVAAFAECTGNKITGKDMYPSMARKLLANQGKIGLLDFVEYGDLVVLDGHHRHAKAIHAGLKYVPVQLIPFLRHKSVKSHNWHVGKPIVPAERIFYDGKNPELNEEAKDTKFGIEGLDGVIRRAISGQPRFVISGRNLSPAFDFPRVSLDRVLVSR